MLSRASGSGSFHRGATSTTGSLEYNEKLSERRANCVYEMLMECVQTKKSVDECCALPSIKNPTPQSEELQQAVENCVVKEAHRVYHEAGHDIEPEEFRAKYRDWRDSRSAEQSGTDCSNIYEPK